MLNLYLGKNYKSIRPNKNCETSFFCNRKIFFNHSKRKLLNISKRDINYNTIIIKDTNNHRTKFLTETTFHDIHHKTSIQSPKKQSNPNNSQSAQNLWTSMSRPQKYITQTHKRIHSFTPVLKILIAFLFAHSRN